MFGAEILLNMKAMEEEMKHYPLKNIFNKIRSCLKDIINDHKKSDTWKTQLIIAIKFISSKDTDEERVMHSKSDNIETMINHFFVDIKLG